MSINKNIYFLNLCIFVVFFAYLNITKIHAQTHFEWTQQLGGVYLDEVTTIFTDPQGNSYLTGMLQDSTFFDDESAVSFDIFAAKYDVNGNQQWLTKLGSTDIESANSISVDPNGNTYITGYFNGQFASPQGDTLRVWQDKDMITIKLNPNGQPEWVRQAASNSETEGLAVVANDQGEVYVAGLFKDRIAFDIDEFSLSNDSLIFNGQLYITPIVGLVLGDDTLTVQADTLVFNSDTTVVTSSNSTRIYSNRLQTDSENRDIVLVKYDTNGNLLWNKRLGGFESDVLTDMALDPSGNLLLTGYFWGATEFDSQALTSAGKNDIFVTKLTSDGSLLWAVSAGGAGNDISHAIAINSSGSPYITGTYDFNSTFGDLTIYGAVNDFFMASFDAEGNTLEVQNATGEGAQIGTDIAIDKNTQSIYVTGIYENLLDFQGLNTIGAIGRKSIFVAKYLDNNLQTLLSIDGENEATSLHNPHIGADSDGNAYLTAYFTKKLQLGLESIGSSDILLGRINNTIISSLEKETFFPKNSLIKVSIFPNPTSSNITIDLSKVIDNQSKIKFEINNIIGQSIYQSTQEFPTNKPMIDLSDLAKGIYYLKITKGEATKTFEIVKN